MVLTCTFYRVSAGAFRPLFTHTFKYIAYHKTSYNYNVTCFQGIKTVLKLITDNLQQFNLSYNMDKNCFIYNVFFSNRLKSFVGNTENTENTGNTENTENTGNTEYTEYTGNTGNTGNTKNTRNTENTE